MKFNIWNKWDKLKTVMLGTVYPIEFYDDIKDNRIRDPLCRITEESMEDLQKYETILKDFGCEVIRCPSKVEGGITAYDGTGGKPIPRNSLQPRDGHFVAGNTLVHTCVDNKGIGKSLLSLKPEKYLIHPALIQGQKSIFDAPAVTVVGKDIYFDTVDTHYSFNLKEDILDWFEQKLPDFRLNTVSIGGHNDSCFHTIKEGVLLSLYDIQDYAETFPGWEVHYISHQGWMPMAPFLKMKRNYPETGGKWWVPGEENNEAFINYVELWLNEWVGFCEETVFDVNVLVLDEHHVCVVNCKQRNKPLEEFLKKHKMEPIYVPWRHRYFWDGGIHCITLDLEREGTQQDYFPERGKQGITAEGEVFRVDPTSTTPYPTSPR